MLEIDNAAGATKDCARCGARAFYWRSAVVAHPEAPRWDVAPPHRAGVRGGDPGVVARRQPAWTCMNCGYIEPHDRRDAPRDGLSSRG